MYAKYSTNWGHKVQRSYASQHTSEFVFSSSCVCPTRVAIKIIGNHNRRPDEDVTLRTLTPPYEDDHDNDDDVDVMILYTI